MTIPSCFLYTFFLKNFKLFPDTFISPVSISNSPAIKRISVLFPDPLGPIIATFSPSHIFRFILLKHFQKIYQIYKKHFAKIYYRF